MFLVTLIPLAIEVIFTTLTAIKTYQNIRQITMAPLPPLVSKTQRTFYLFLIDKSFVYLFATDFCEFHLLAWKYLLIHRQIFLRTHVQPRDLQVLTAFIDNQLPRHQQRSNLDPASKHLDLLWSLHIFCMRDDVSCSLPSSDSSLKSNGPSPVDLYVVST
jgi:hypothetical protein